MRETGSLHEEMINRNWVLKRKRKRVSSGLDVSKKRGSASRGSDSPKSRSVKMKLRDVEVSDVGDKMKGNDGDDFECDVCNRGGDLLCCESCQRTYHLECLNPPLKRAPHGKWQCYSCCEEDKDVNPPSKSSSRRARSKSNFEKSKSVNKLSGNFDKASVSGQSLVVQRDKLDTDNNLLPVSAPSIERNLECHQVAKSYSPKSSRSGDSGSRQHVSPEGDSRIKKKGSSLLRKTNSHEESCTLIETSNTDAKTKSSKGQGIPTRNVKRRNKNILSLARSTQISKEDRQKFNGFDKKKSSRTHKEKHAAAVSNTISKETYLLPETRRSLRKPKPFDRRDYASLSKEESRVTKSAIKKHAKMLPHEQSTSSHGVDKIIKFHENVLEGVQQVDRVLGCRVQPNSVISSSHSQAIKSSVSVAIRESEIDSGKSAANILQSSNSIDSENGHKLLEKNSVGKVQNMGDVETLHDEDMDYNNAASEEKTHETKDSKDQDKDNAMMFATEPSQDVHTVQTGCEAQGESVKAESEDITRGPSEDVNIAESSCKVEEESVKIDSKEIMNGEIPVEMLDKSLKNIKPILAEQELGSQNKNAVAYEFLVKWVGQSNIHNSWISESQLKVLAKRKLENYKAKYGTALINISEEQWCKPQRVIALRVSKGGAREVLTKWCGLPYDECTWERLDEPIIKKYAHLVAQFEQFESQTLEKNARDVIPRVKVDCDEVASLTEQPKELQGGSLFPHQLEALNWLRKCWHKSRNVILADEMGLGKTVSASAFISSLYIEFKVNLPCLVLVPLSTMPNWLAEFALWAPHLNVVEYHGPAIARSIIRQYEWHANDPDKSRWVPMAYKFNVLLTTYEMVLADSSHLRGVPWEVLIVDEGHRLKNSSSKLFSLLNTFSFQHRVLLTGTPLQNNIGEMYNLLNFLQPLSFPSLSAFEENFNDLTTAEKVDELKKLVAPHMLRRLKKDAMQNIPPKTERMVPVELTSIQAEYYRAMLTKNYQILRNVGKGVPQQSMLNIIMQLRKVCNHPYLIPGTEPESGSIEFLQEMRIKASAKLTLLHSMLKSLHKEGHRVLIFSQMTKLLDILEDYLVIEFGPKTYERVDGSVSVADRQTSIARFNQDKSRFVFLLSTRSCGLGINLATADTVIIYDSDFNPHADIQAMNRAHRIGQSNRLLVYRLVVRASVEERILQLAKRKLMLDQLFVNKAESQKEVEDIIRWGTEELFNDCDGVNGHNLNEPSTSQLETVTEGEHKHRRRSGGLGDVYQDKCTNGSTKIVWDDNAIMKLLDRTNLPTSVSESADGELENDMLGTVKSLDWNDELNDELGETELLRTVTEGGCDQSSEVREDNAINATEENDWDRLLRVRWERYQTEEEAALGRGKRLRKAVSYKEAYATMPNEVFSESGNEGEEPEPVYTPAGRALKEKYSKLRARQKQRIAHRFTTEALLREPEEPSVREAQSLDGNIHADDAREEDSPLNLVETNISQPFESKSGRIDSIFKAGRLSKHGFKRHHSNHLDLSVDPSPPPDLLPVLGLCAPNANRMNSVHRKPHSTVNKSTDEHTQSSPQPASSQGNDLNIGRSNPTGDQSLFSDMFGEALQHRRKHILPDYFPFYPLPPNMPGRVPPDPQESSGGSFSSFHERFGLANLTPEENQFLPFPLPSRNAMKPPPDCFPSLSLGRNLDGSPQNLSKIPLPIHTVDSLKQKQIMGELPPMPGLGQMQITHPLLPENHKKVLDSIMLRTQSNKFLKKRINVDEWSEDELDALWIGVRRHGRGNWAAMLRDSKLKFSQSKTPDDLASRWIVEEPKIMGRSAFPEPKLSKPLSISDGMMSKALFGSNFANVGGETLKFRSHLSDIQQACGDFIKGFPFTQLGSLGAVNSSYPPMPAWLSNKLGSSNSSDFHVAPFHRSELPLDHPFQLHPIQGTSLESHSMNMSSSGRSRQNEDELRGSKKPKLPFFLDKSLNLLRDTHNNFQSTGSSMGMPPNLKMKQVSVTSPSDAQGSSKADALPHWLREAVSVPHPKAPEPHLPPTVSAIAQSVRILYGEKKPAIPPFSIPGPLPLQPKDPRKKFKKKKLQRSLQEMPEIVKSNMEPDTGTSLPPLNLNLNLNSPSSSPSDTKVKKLSVELSIQATPGMSNSSCKNNELPLPDNLENFELVEKGVVEEESQKEQEASISQESKHKQVDPVESRDLCMTRSDHGGDHLIQANEISSKETVSVEHKSEQEP